MNVSIKELRLEIDGRGLLMLCFWTAQTILNCVFFDVFVKYRIKLSSLSFDIEPRNVAQAFFILSISSITTLGLE